MSDTNTNKDAAAHLAIAEYLDRIDVAQDMTDVATIVRDVRTTDTDVLAREYVSALGMIAALLHDRTPAFTKQLRNAALSMTAGDVQ